VLSHFVAVPMHELPKYMKDTTISASVYLWKLQGSHFERLKRTCSRLGFSDEIPKQPVFADLLTAILRQPGNRKFSLGHACSGGRYQEIRAAEYGPRGFICCVACNCLCGSSPTPDTSRLSSGTVLLASPILAHGAIPTVAASPTNGFAASLGPLNWESFGRILDHRRHEIDVLRTRERESVHTILTMAARDDFRQRMLKSWKAVLLAMQVEERALEQLQANYDACVVRATGGGSIPPSTASNNVLPPASAEHSKRCKTSGLNEEGRNTQCYQVYVIACILSFSIARRSYENSSHFKCNFIFH
jgi:hypothetical protein